MGALIRLAFAFVGLTIGMAVNHNVGSSEPVPGWFAVAWLFFTVLAFPTVGWVLGDLVDKARRGFSGR